MIVRGGIAHHPNREAKNLIAVHLQVRSIFREEAGGFGHKCAPARHVQMLVSGAIRPENRRENAPWLVGGFEHNRPRAIAEEDAG